MEIRKATLNDLESLIKLCTTTFIQTYAIHNTAENLNDYLEKNFNPTQLSKEIQSDTEGYFLLFDQDLPIAYVKLNYNCCPPNMPGEQMIEIQRIYVSGEYQKKGLGKELLKIAESEAMQSGAPYIWLGVWENNHQAIRFYTENGFSIMGTHDFWLGNDRQTDFIMSKKVVG